MKQGIGKVSGLFLIAIGVGAGMAVSVTPLRAHVTSGFRHLWEAHIRPRADARYLPGATLPRGVTLRGTWKMGGTNPTDGTTTHAVGDISFGYSFSSAPTVVFAPFYGPQPPECPGTIDEPEALPGYLCLYEEWWSNNGVVQWDPPKRFGVNLYLFSNPAADLFWNRGTWAATSP